MYVQNSVKIEMFVLILKTTKKILMMKEKNKILNKKKRQVVDREKIFANLTSI